VAKILSATGICQIAGFLTATLAENRWNGAAEIPSPSGDFWPAHATGLVGCANCTRGPGNPTRACWLRQAGR
jgi:hypothetical protein